jgi:uncharacterized protein involved in exopolysaccharide biosynthesis
VDTNELIKQLFIRLQKTKLIILSAGVVLAVLFVFLFANKAATYTSKATLFPLTSPTDNGISSSMLSGILGLSDAPKSFSSEATINIIELALSRSIREQVAVTKLPAFQNKSIGELLIDEENNQHSFFTKNIPLPKDSTGVAIAGGEILKTSINAKMSKNGVLELYFTSYNQALVSPVSYALIDKLSKFYIDLKRQKASDDYNFTLDKIDSLQLVINGVDKRAIGIQQTTMFAPPEMLEYNIPKNNISAKKRGWFASGICLSTTGMKPFGTFKK